MAREAGRDGQSEILHAPDVPVDPVAPLAYSPRLVGDAHDLGFAGGQLDDVSGGRRIDGRPVLPDLYAGDRAGVFPCDSGDRRILLRQFHGDGFGGDIPLLQ